MKKTTWVVILTYLVVNLWYYHSFWQELKFDTSTVEARYGEVLATEWGIEQAYQNIVAGKNPFAWREGAFYPFGTEFAATDSGNAFYFVFLRPWLSTHQAMSITVALSIYGASVGMYLLLRKLKIDVGIAGVLGLAFAYTTFLLPRMGHLTYMSIYVFPWFYLSALTMISKEKLWNRLLGALGSAFFFAMALYHNLYYFVTLGLSVGLMGGYYLGFFRNELASMIRHSWRMIIVGGMIFVILISPWLVTLREVTLFGGLPKTEGWGGAIQFSADLFGILIPSYYSRYLRGAAIWTDQNLIFAKGIFENYIYPGLMILVTVAVWGYLLITKKVSEVVKRQVAPWMFAGFWLWSLTLGPFLHVAGKWTLELQEGIKLVVPLPFALFHYLPFMSNIRSPGRLAIGYIFVVYVAVAYIWQAWGRRLFGAAKIIVLIGLGAVFYFDHSIKYALATPTPLPNDIYGYIQRDPGSGAVEEIPGAIRDGFIYFGNTDRLNFIAGQLIHNKPILAGYSGRVPGYKFAYYQQNAWLGYVGRLTDPDVANNGGLNRTDLSKWQQLNEDEAARAIDFLDIKYIILYPDTPGYVQIRGELPKLGYREVMSDQLAELWQREIVKQEYLDVKIGESGDELQVAGNWYGRDQDFRWMQKSAQILLKVTESRNMKLNLVGSSYHLPQTAQVYLNRQWLGTLELNTTKQSYGLNVPREMLKTGINYVQIQTPKAWQPKVVDLTSMDGNFLSAQFSEVYLE